MSKVVELKARGVRAELRQAWLTRSLVRLWRGRLEPGSFSGYIAHLGPEYFLMWVVGDYIGFDGLYALRYRDVTELELPDGNYRFLEKAIALKALNPTWPSSFNLDNVADIVRAASSERPVVAVHVDTEGEHEVCYVGRLLAFEADGFTVQEISPDAEWLAEPSYFGYDEVSAISFGGPYSEALAQVAGDPPPVNPSKRETLQ
jgi:hypothetical protein